MEFPTLFYKLGGKHKCQGGTFSFCTVKDNDEAIDLFKYGWYPSLEIALKEPETFCIYEFLDLEKPDSEEMSQPDDDSPPTRDELEKKAKELGIGFNAKTKDETLLEKISSVISEAVGGE